MGLAGRIAGGVATRVEAASTSSDFGRTEPHRVLIVDDALSELDLMSRALEDMYEIQFATNGEDALELIAAQAPDLLILDVIMPGIDGLETLRRLRASPGGRSVPVILLTADDRVETQVAGLELGAEDFVTKPFILPALKARIRNVLERRDLLGQLEASLQKLKLVSELNAILLSSAGEGIYSVDLDGVCTSINPQALSLLGYTRDEVLGEASHRLFHHHYPDGRTYPVEDCPVYLTLRDGKQRTVEDAFHRKHGGTVPVQMTVTAIRLDDAIVGAEVLFSDISERLEMQRELLRMATTDELTGAVNRRRFLELATAEHARVARYGRPGALLMIDLDHFKAINDAHGHGAGDTVLKVFARTLADLLRAGDVFARIGGEEFAILLPETDLMGAVGFASRVRQAVEDMRFVMSGASVAITASFGVTEIGRSDGVFDDVMRRADKALYVAKTTGRNRVESA